MCESGGNSVGGSNHLGGVTSLVSLRLNYGQKL